MIKKEEYSEKSMYALLMIGLISAIQIVSINNADWDTRGTAN